MPVFILLSVNFLLLFSLFFQDVGLASISKDMLTTVCANRSITEYCSSGPHLSICSKAVAFASGTWQFVFIQQRHFHHRRCWKISPIPVVFALFHSTENSISHHGQPLATRLKFHYHQHLAHLFSPFLPSISWPFTDTFWFRSATAHIEWTLHTTSHKYTTVNIHGHIRHSVGDN